MPLHCGLPIPWLVPFKFWVGRNGPFPVSSQISAIDIEQQPC